MGFFPETVGLRSLLCEYVQGSDMHLWIIALPFCPQRLLGSLVPRENSALNMGSQKVKDKRLGISRGGPQCRLRLVPGLAEAALA